jgi:hypothetical protein
MKNEKEVVRIFKDSGLYGRHGDTVEKTILSAIRFEVVNGYIDKHSFDAADLEPDGHYVPDRKGGWKLKARFRKREALHE